MILLRPHLSVRSLLSAVACLSVAVLGVFPSGASPAASSAPDYSFDGTITSAVLENYLARALQGTSMCGDAGVGPSPTFDDDLRMISNLGAKFVGRAAVAWDLLVPEETHFADVRRNAARIHAVDPDIILQACIFEIVHTSVSLGRKTPGPGVDSIPVPDWVFSEFGLEPEKRCFRYEDMLYPDGSHAEFWGPHAAAPDVARLETRMWYYYRARRYIDAGYEALHFGQPALTGQNDPFHEAWDDLLSRIRAYARIGARRHTVLCDAHHVVTLDGAAFESCGRLLWDFVSFPLRPEETSAPLAVRLRVGYRDSMYARVPGGLHPAGWTCGVLPQLYEFDNCAAGLTTSPVSVVWGADESTWFANLPAPRRDDFLRYAHGWIADNAPGGHLQMPGRRPAFIPASSSPPRHYWYSMNTRSAACPAGMSQEETVKAIWTQTVRPRVEPGRSPGDPAEPEETAQELTSSPSLQELRSFYSRHGIPASEL